MKRGRHISITREELLNIGKVGTAALDRIGSLRIEFGDEKFETPEIEKMHRMRMSIGIILSFANKVIKDNISNEKEEKQYWEKFIEIGEILRLWK